MVNPYLKAKHRSSAVTVCFYDGANRAQDIASHYSICEEETSEVSVCSLEPRGRGFVRLKLCNGPERKKYGWVDRQNMVVQCGENRKGTGTTKEKTRFFPERKCLLWFGENMTRGTTKNRVTYSQR